MSATDTIVCVPEWRSGTGKVIRVGDTVRVDRSAHRADVRGHYRYRVKEIRVCGDVVEVTVFGGKPQHEKYCTFVEAVLHVVRIKAVAS